MVHGLVVSKHLLCNQAHHLLYLGLRNLIYEMSILNQIQLLKYFCSIVSKVKDWILGAYLF